MEDCAIAMWSMVGSKIYKKCAQVYKLEERIKELEAENKKLIEGQQAMLQAGSGGKVVD